VNKIQAIGTVLFGFFVLILQRKLIEVGHCPPASAITQAVGQAISLWHFDADRS
jgi:hypothetical protein